MPFHVVHLDLEIVKEVSEFDGILRVKCIKEAQKPALNTIFQISFRIKNECDIWARYGDDVMQDKGIHDSYSLITSFV